MLKQGVKRLVLKMNEKFIFRHRQMQVDMRAFAKKMYEYRMIFRGVIKTHPFSL